MEHLETQLKKEVEKRNRFRMIVHTLEVFFDNLSQELKSVRLDILTPSNLEETLSKFSLKASPSIEKFCHELKRFVRNVSI